MHTSAIMRNISIPKKQHCKIGSSVISTTKSIMNDEEHISDVHLIMNSTILRESLNSLIKDNDWEQRHGNAIRFLASYRAEILLKGLIYLSGKKYKASHDLQNLFNQLNDNLKEDAVCRYLLLRKVPNNKETNEQFKADLKLSKSIFVSLRYSHAFRGIYSNEKLRQKVLGNWKASPRFLLLFSEALQHIYLIRISSDSVINSKKKFSQQKNMLTNYKSKADD